MARKIKETPNQPPDDSTKGSGGANGGGGGEYHPFIQGLLHELPKPGEKWPTEKRFNWLTTANGIFNMIYKTEDNEPGKIELKLIANPGDKITGTVS